jgi:hypothetical protein
MTLDPVPLIVSLPLALMITLFVFAAPLSSTIRNHWPLAAAAVGSVIVRAASVFVTETMKSVTSTW